MCVSFVFGIVICPIVVCGGRVWGKDGEERAVVGGWVRLFVGDGYLVVYFRHRKSGAAPSKHAHHTAIQISTHDHIIRTHTYATQTHAPRSRHRVGQGNVLHMR